MYGMNGLLCQHPLHLKNSYIDFNVVYITELFNLLSLPINADIKNSALATFAVLWICEYMPQYITFKSRRCQHGAMLCCRQ